MKKNLTVFLFLFFASYFVYAQQKATIVSDDVDVYAEQDFDSEILETVHKNETYWISNKTFGPFYRIKLKSGKIGYIPDHELNILGKGPFRPKAFGEDSDTDSKTNSKTNAKPTTKLAKKKSQFDQEMDENDQIEDDAEDGGEFHFHALSLHLINLHEDTMGDHQVADLLAIGYKRISQDYAWGGFMTWKAPDYYAKKTGGNANGFSFWGDIAANYFLPLNARFMARISPGITTRYSMVEVEANNKKYDLQDLTVGVFIEAGILLRLRKTYAELSLRFNHEKNDYGSLGISILF